MNFRWVAAIAAAALIQSIAFADVDQRVLNQLAESDDGDAKSAGAGYTSKAVIEAQDGKGIATLRAARLDEFRDTVYFKSALSITTPFNAEKDDTKDIGTLSGLTSGSSAALEFGVLSWPSFSAPEEQRIREVCATSIPQLLPGFTWADAKNIENDIYYSFAGGMGCEERLFDALPTIVQAINSKRLAGYEAAAKKALESGAAVPTPPPPVLLARDWPQLAGRAKRKIRLANAAGFQGMHSAHLRVIANQQEFSYVLDSDLANVIKDSHTGRGASLSYSWIRRTYVFNGGYQYERTFEAVPATQVCQPIGETTSTACKAATIGAPKRTTRRLAFAEIRKRFDGKHPIAVSPRVEYDVETHDFAVRVPVYLVMNGAGDLVGGAALGWSEEDDVGVSVFFAKAFSFFGD